MSMMIDTEEMTMKTDTEEKGRKRGELFDKKCKIENNSFINNSFERTLGKQMMQFLYLSFPFILLRCKCRMSRFHFTWFSGGKK